ncbi:putative ribonuclease H-like domain-containing protein [Tanacetum coccineum]
MAYTSNSLGSDIELGLESVEAQLLIHQKNEVVYEEKIAVLEFEVKHKSNAITRLKNHLDETLREKDELKAKLEKFETSSKNLTKLINSQISSNDKTGLGYGDQLNENDSSGSELFNSMFDSRSSDGDDNQTNNRFKNDSGYHVVPPPLIGNYMPPLADLSFAGLDDSVYRPIANKTSASVSQVETSITPPSNTNVEMPRVESVRPPPNTRISNEKVNTVRVNGVNTAGQTTVSAVKGNGGNPQQALKNKGIFDNRCYRHMTGNKDFLSDYQYIDGGFVAFGGSSRGGKITGKGKIRTNKLDFEDVFFVKELKFNLFSVSQMCDKKNSALFTETECFVLSLDFKLLDASQALLRVPRLGHVNFKTMNKLVKGNLVRGLPLKIFENDHTCIACQKGKQHKASYKAKLVSSISQPLQMLHMDLFGPTSVRSINHKTYYLVVTDDFSRTKFKNKEMNEFYRLKGIKREFSVARTPQQNGVAERKNMTLIEAARTMLADSLLPTVFWAEAVNSTCYVLNRVLVTKPHNKTPYELIISRSPSISFMRPFGCPVTILNTLDPLGKFDGKAGEGFLVAYSINSKAFRVFNSQTRKVEENLHSSDKNDTAADSAGKSHVQNPASENEQALKNVLDKMMDQEKEATKQSDAVRKEFEEQCNRHNLSGKATKASSTNSFNTVSTPVNAASASRTYNDDGSSFVPLGGSFPDDPLMPDLEDTAEVQHTNIFGSAYDDEDLDTYNSPYADQVMGAEADFNNMEPSTVVSPIPSTRVHSIHPKDQIIRDPRSAVASQLGEVERKHLPEKEQSDEEAATDYKHEKEELRMSTVISYEEEIVDPKILSTKYPIVDWEYQNLGNVYMEDLYVYKILRADRNTIYHKLLSSKLRIFDRQDLVDLHRLVMKRFEDTTPEVHTLLMDGTLTSFKMLVEKRYPLIKEMLQKMLNWKLEAEAESTMAFELLKFIKSRLEE